jgi:polyphosphate glucokinase
MTVLVIDVGGTHIKILATGKKRRRRQVVVVIEKLKAALQPDDVVIGGGNAKKLDVLPIGCRLGDNANAFIGGFQLWQEWHV